MYAGAQRAVAPPAMPAHPTTLQGPLALHVEVTDGHGNPVTGLRQSDFTLLDEGKPAAIRGFAAAAGVDGGGKGPAGSPANETEAGPKPAVEMTLVIDEVNASFIGVSIERVQLGKFFTQNGGKLPFPVTVLLVTDTGMRQMAAATSDGNLLQQELQNETGELRDLRRSSGFYGAAERMQLSLNALQRIADVQVQLPGRKLLVWISPGWAIFDSPNVYLSGAEQRGFFAGIRGLTDTLLAANTTLYSVDPEGTYDAGSMHTFEWQSFLKPVKEWQHAEPGNTALQVLAVHSGGTAAFGSNDVAGEIERCARDGETGYTLKFDPEQGSGDEHGGGNWHSLEVKVDRPGMKVRTSYGYYAQP